MYRCDIGTMTMTRVTANSKGWQATVGERYGTSSRFHGRGHSKDGISMNFRPSDTYIYSVSGQCQLFTFLFQTDTTNSQTNKKLLSMKCSFRTNIISTYVCRTFYSLVSLTTKHLHAIEGLESFALHLRMLETAQKRKQSKSI